MSDVKRYTVANCWEKLGNETEVVAAADYDSLLRKFAEVERDARRVDWLETRGHMTKQRLDGSYYWTTAFDSQVDCDKTLRAAIDSAMPGEG